MAITLKVQILGITKPPCWRRIVVPNDITFLDLHYAIQDCVATIRNPQKRQ